MERITITKAKELLGKRFLGVQEISSLSEKLGIISPLSLTTPVPEIPFTEKEIISAANSDFCLILFVPFQRTGNDLISINWFRKHLGFDPEIYEPCLYNQDWYLNEPFANTCELPLSWHLLKCHILDQSRGRLPEQLIRSDVKQPNALLLLYLFFANYFYNNEILFKNDFVWTSDFDSYGDRIYVGRYIDPIGVAKNGFSIHRFLSVRQNYGSII